MLFFVKNCFFFSYIALFGSFLPYLACCFFDTPLTHGLLSFDIFVFAVLCCLPYGKLLWKLAFAVLPFIFALAGNDVGSFLAGGIYLLSVLLFSLFHNKIKVLSICFVMFALFSIIADWGVFFYSTFNINLTDVWDLAKFYWWGILLFFLTPVLQLALLFFFSRNTLFSKGRVKIPHPVGLAFLVIFGSIHLGVGLWQIRQPFFDFPVKAFMWQYFTPGQISHNSILQEDIKRDFLIYGGPHIVVKSSKPTVVVLMESFGINKNPSFTKNSLEFFKNANVTFAGLYARTAAHTQGSEWEDFNMPTGDSTNISLAAQFREQGFETWYLHGYDAKFYSRNELYEKGAYGFDSLFFKEDFKVKGHEVCENGLTGICDSSIAGFIDSLLNQGTQKFVYWTTLDAHPPYEKVNIKESSKVCKELSLTEVECVYITVQENTARTIVELANKHPEYQFIIRGDHRPMGSLEQTDFVESFYYRWVPLIILN